MIRFRQWRLCKSQSLDQSVLSLAAIGVICGLALLVTHARAADDEPAEKKIPAPVDIDLKTSDGLQLKATYYGSNTGKNAVPIIMLHGWKGTRADFAGLALDMQARGCAVIVPDLRGHGKSTQIDRNGESFTIDQATLRKGDIEAMITQDMEALDTFLLERNNAGELNIEKLCVVGNEMGATVAINWSLYNWHWPQLPTIRQGQDVKALVLISPVMNFRGINIAEALSRPLLRTDLSILIIAGDKGKGMQDAKRINTILSAARPKPPSDPKEVEDRQDLFFSVIRGATLQGPNILNDKTILPQLALVVGQFVEWRLINKKFPWTDRPSALGSK